MLTSHISNQIGKDYFSHKLFAKDEPLELQLAYSESEACVLPKKNSVNQTQKLLGISDRAAHNDLTTNSLNYVEDSMSLFSV